MCQPLTFPLLPLCLTSGPSLTPCGETVLMVLLHRCYEVMLGNPQVLELYKSGDPKEVSVLSESSLLFLPFPELTKLF